MLHVKLVSRPFDGAGIAARRRSGAPYRRTGFAVLLFASYSLGAIVGGASPAVAHGVVGQRFFPATLTTDDPFVADELSLPTVTHQKTSTDPSVKQTDINVD